MSSILIRNVDPSIKERLRRRAANHGHSMEEEARVILAAGVRDTADEETGADLLAQIRKRLEPIGFIELEIPPRTPSSRESPDFS